MPAVSSFVHPSQKGFLRGKHFTDHVVDLNKKFYDGVIKKLERFIFSMDTAKAFDSIDHEWIFFVLKKIGFPSWFLHFYGSLFSSAVVFPFFGGETKIPILIERGVKQGCPLSPIIFVLIYDSLLCSLSSIPGVSPYACADDVALSFTCLPILDICLERIDIFSQLSGLGVARNKGGVISSVPIASPLRFHWDDLCIVPSFLYLGVPFGASVTLENVFERPLKAFRVKSSLFFSTFKRSSIRFKNLLCNVYLLSLFSYLACFFCIPKEILDEVNLFFRSFCVPLGGRGVHLPAFFCLENQFFVNPPLKDLWCYNVALLASRSPLISMTGTFSSIPPVSLRNCMHIFDHRNAAAKDFWLFSSRNDILEPPSNLSSSKLYKILIEKYFSPISRENFFLF
jgi:hypothetical protein